MERADKHNEYNSERYGNLIDYYQTRYDRANRGLTTLRSIRDKYNNTTYQNISALERQNIEAAYRAIVSSVEIDIPTDSITNSFEAL